MAIPWYVRFFCELASKFALMDALTSLDLALFFLINGWHAPWADLLMVGLSAKLTWVPAYLALLIALYRRLGWRRLVIGLLCVGALIGVTDRVSAGLLKPQVQRLRPCHAELLREVRLPEHHCGGKYGFVSSHAANFFGLATLMSLIFGAGWWRWVFFGSAAMVAYSRVYLGVHYPSDVLGGALLGLLAGWLIYRLFAWAIRRFISPSASPRQENDPAGP